MDHVSQKTTALIILNYNNFKDTINCIESVEGNNTAPIKYIVVDNGSTNQRIVDSLHQYLKNRFGDCFVKMEEDGRINQPLAYCTLLVSKTNDGYARGNNKGLELAYQDETITDIMILNNDVLFVEDIIPGLLNRKLNIRDCAIISPILYKKNFEEYDYNCARRNQPVRSIIINYLLLYRDIFGIIKRSFDNLYIIKTNPDILKQDTCQIELPSGSCMLIEKDYFKKIGGFDPNTFLYYEENILYKKVKKTGMQNYLVPSLKCIHLGASSTSKSPSSFILKTGLQSKDYYLKNYENLTAMQTIGWWIAKTVFSVKIYAKSIVG